MAFLPHICAEAHAIEVDHFRRDEFGRAEEHFELFGRIELSGQAEIDDLDSMSIPIDAENVLRLDEQRPRCLRVTRARAVRTFISRWTM